MLSARGRVRGGGHRRAHPRVCMTHIFQQHIAIRSQHTGRDAGVSLEVHMTQQFEMPQLQKAFWIGCAIGIAAYGSASAQTIGLTTSVKPGAFRNTAPVDVAHLSRRTI